MAAAAKFHSYRTVLIQMQATDATRVGGYNTWKAVGRQVSKGEKGIAILAPVVRKVDVDAAAEEDTSTQTEERRRIVAFTQAYVFDISQTQGEPLPEPPQPTLLQGQAPEGLWDQLFHNCGSGAVCYRQAWCGGVGVVARMARRVGAPTATNPGATRACYDLTEPCP